MVYRDRNKVTVTSEGSSFCCLCHALLLLQLSRDKHKVTVTSEAHMNKHLSFMSPTLPPCHAVLCYDRCPVTRTRSQ